MKIKKIIIIAAMALTMVGCASTQPDKAPYKEETVQIDSKRDTKIQGTLTVPTTKTDDGYGLVVMAHGFLGSRDESGSFTKVAQELAKKGYASIRIDFPGCNESKESFLNYSLNNMQDDITNAITYVKKEIKIKEDKIGMLGYSMGGRVTSLYLDKQTMNTVVLWAPAVSDGVSAMAAMGDEQEIEQKIEASKESGKSTITMWGNDIDVSHDYLAQMKESEPTKNLAAFKGSILFITGGKDDVVTKNISDQGINACVNTKVTAHLEVPRADHNMGAGFTDDKDVNNVVTNATIDFFVEQMN